jgi:hypothetical protein
VLTNSQISKVRLLSLLLFSEKLIGKKITGKRMKNWEKKGLEDNIRYLGEIVLQTFNAVFFYPQI